MVLEIHGKLKFLFDSLVTVNGKARTMQDREKWTPEFVSVELFKVQKYRKTRKVLKIFESDS